MYSLKNLKIVNEYLCVYVCVCKLVIYSCEKHLVFSYHVQHLFMKNHISTNIFNVKNIRNKKNNLGMN